MSIGLQKIRLTGVGVAALLMTVAALPSHAADDAAALRAENKMLRSQVQRQTSEIAELKAKLAKLEAQAAGAAPGRAAPATAIRVVQREPRHHWMMPGLVACARIVS